MPATDPAQIPPHPVRRRPIALAAAAIAAAAIASLIVAACGSSGNGETAAAPGDCVELWNEEPSAQTFGRHVYRQHDARQGRMAMLAPVAPTPVLQAGTTCSMIFAVPENDEEYGDVGLVLTMFGWASMKELSRRDPAHLDGVQREAADAPNVTVFPDGSIDAG